MDIILISLIATGVIILALIILNAFLLAYFYKTHKKFDELLEKGKIKDFKDILLSQKEKHSDLEEQLKDAFLKIDNLENILSKTIQKTGIVRFNPFSDIGGNQSFAIALLDEKNNGFVISSLFVKEGNRVYAKAVKDGKSEHSLSNEEIEAIDRAISSK